MDKICIQDKHASAGGHMDSVKGMIDALRRLVNDVV
jgi:hypothetical protein